MNYKDLKLHPSTLAVRADMEKTNLGEHTSPIFLTSGFTFDSLEDIRGAFADEYEAYTYSRFTNPNVDELSNKVALLENAESGLSVASGMAAIFGTFMTYLSAGDHLICCRSVFGGTNGIVNKYLPKFGIEYTYVEANDPAAWEKAIRPNTKMIYFETPTNPQLQIIDMEMIATMGRKNKILTVVDNCFATPFLQRPLDFGIDIVIHSATKWMDGQGRVLAGIIVGSKALVHEIYLFCRSIGPVLSPFSAWIISKSLETLPVRIERHSASALYLAGELEKNGHINFVRYPFLPSHPDYELAKKQMSAGGGLVSMEIKGGLLAAQRFMDKLQWISITGNLGDSRTIVSHPKYTTHAKLSEEERLKVEITPGLVRLSVGLEHAEDILNDIKQALEGS